jgi:glycosyltransferase involved in cell wall biosynthesis
LVNSHHVAKRVDAWWGQPATVVTPPVDLDTYTPDPQTQREDFFLLAGRLVPYKRPLVAVDAARAAGVPLVVVGDGRLRADVCARADGNIEVLGPVDQTTLRNLYRRCRALVFPGEEDFGIVPVEAQACGTPVLARAVGGVLDTVTDGVTGMLYQQGTRSEVHALRDAMLTFDPTAYDPATIRAHTERFSASAFRSRVQAEVERALGGTTPTGSSPPSGTP